VSKFKRIADLNKALATTAMELKTCVAVPTAVGRRNATHQRIADAGSWLVTKLKAAAGQREYYCSSTTRLRHCVVPFVLGTHEPLLLSLVRWLLVLSTRAQLVSWSGHFEVEPHAFGVAEQATPTLALASAFFRERVNTTRDSLSRNGTLRLQQSQIKP